MPGFVILFQCRLVGAYDRWVHAPAAWIRLVYAEKAFNLTVGGHGTYLSLKARDKHI